jgi:hypothetical protein
MGRAARETYWKAVREGAWDLSKEKFSWLSPIASAAIVFVLTWRIQGWSKVEELVPPLVFGGIAAVAVAVVVYSINVARASRDVYLQQVALIAPLESELVKLREAATERRTNRQLAGELADLRTYGLTYIRNEFEANPANLPIYLQREKDWLTQITQVMERYGCSRTDIARVRDITFSEIGRAAAGATYGPDGNWLIGVMEMRLSRLAWLIAKYEE